MMVFMNHFNFGFQVKVFSLFFSGKKAPTFCSFPCVSFHRFDVYFSFYIIYKSSSLNREASEEIEEEKEIEMKKEEGEEHRAILLALTNQKIIKSRFMVEFRYRH
jgi:hypothetical protein